MATLTRQQVTGSGLQATYANAAGGGDVVDNRDGKTFLHVKNGSGGAITVTVTAQDTTAVVSGYGTLTVSDITASVASGQEEFIGPFPKQGYNNASNQIAITYSGVTSLTIAALYI